MHWTLLSQVSLDNSFLNASLVPFSFTTSSNTALTVFLSNQGHRCLSWDSIHCVRCPIFPLHPRTVEWRFLSLLLTGWREVSVDFQLCNRPFLLPRIVKALSWRTITKWWASTIWRALTKWQALTIWQASTFWLAWRSWWCGKIAVLCHYLTLWTGQFSTCIPHAAEASGIERRYCWFELFGLNEFTIGKGFQTWNSE